jgi:phosphate:Na+ symporter
MFLREFLIPLSTGLVIFLFGMQVMRFGFENLFIDQVKSVLQKLTSSPLVGMLTGTVTTALMQSSSAVSLITIALTNARMMSLRQAMGIILGANIGTSLTTELIAFQIHDLGLYFFVLGCALFLVSKAEVRGTGMVIGGFGLLFIGLNTMQAILPYIKQVGWLEALYDFSQLHVLGGIVAGTVATALLQSSTATTAMTMTLMYDGLIPLSIGIAVILGSNIGTCVTAILGSIGGSRGAKQVALFHVLINVWGVLLFLPIFDPFIRLIEWLTSQPAQQLAHAQTIFNVLCSLIFLPFLHWMERIVKAMT